MRRSNLLLLTLFCFGVACSPKQEQVSINFDSFLTEQNPSVIDVSRRQSSPIGKATIEPLPARTVLVGSGRKEADVAIAIAKQNQQKAFDQALSELRKAYRAEANSKAELHAKKIQQEFAIKYEDLFIDLRKEFKRHALQVGPMWTRLATLAGFPDKGKPKRLPPEADFIGRAEAKEADEIRINIAKLDSEYRAMVAGRVEDLKQEFRLSKTNLEAEKVSLLYDADSLAEQEAKNLMAKILNDMHESLIKDIEVLPSLKGQNVGITKQDSMPYKVPDEKSAPWPAVQRARDRALAFCRINGYVLVDAGAKVKDVTKEFLKWDQQMAGH